MVAIFSDVCLCVFYYCLLKKALKNIEHVLIKLNLTLKWWNDSMLMLLWLLFTDVYMAIVYTILDQNNVDGTDWLL